MTPARTLLMWKRGQVQFAGTARRVLRTNWTCPLFRALLTALLAVALGAALAGLAQADQIWTNTTGNGLWSDAGNWSTAEPGAGDLVTFPSPFPGASNEIVLAAGELADSLVFDTSYSFIGGNLTLTTGEVTTLSGNTTIGSALGGTADLAKLGAGKLTLTAANTYSGTTLVGGSGELAWDGSNASNTTIIRVLDNAALSGVGTVPVNGAAIGPTGTLRPSFTNATQMTLGSVEWNLGGTGGTLTFESREERPTFGNYSITIPTISTGSPTTLVAAGTHIGHGSFVRNDMVSPVIATSTQLVGNFYQAFDGDTDNDKIRSTRDVQNILGANSFNNPDDGPYEWTQGDFDGDGDVDVDDLCSLIVCMNPPPPPLITGTSPSNATLGTPGNGIVDLVVALDGTAVIDTDGTSISGFILGSLGGHFTPGLPITFNQNSPGLPLSGVSFSTEFESSAQFFNTSLFPGGITGTINLGQLYETEVPMLDDLGFTYTLAGTVGIFDGTAIGLVPEPLEPFRIKNSPGTLDGATPNFIAGPEPEESVNNAVINAALDAGTNVLISTDNPAILASLEIRQNDVAPIVKTAGGPATLTIRADGKIFLLGSILSTSGPLDVTLIANDPAQAAHDLDPGLGSVEIWGPIEIDGDLTTSGTFFFNLLDGHITANQVTMNHTLNVAIAAALVANTLNITVGDSESVIITDEGTLRGSGTINGNVENNGILSLGSSPGLVTIVGDFDQGASGVLQIEIGGLLPGTEHDQVNATGTATLDGTLTLEGLDSLASLGDATLTILNALTVSGTFASVPLLNDGNGTGHLGFGIFFEGINYNPADVIVDLFQAAAGDTNGDRLVDTTDITNILSANVFENGNPADWTTGDFTGDGFVTTDDITAILELNLFETGLYAALLDAGFVTTATNVTAVPEPSSLALAVLALLGLVTLRWRRQEV